MGIWWVGGGCETVVGGEVVWLGWLGMAGWRLCYLPMLHT